MAKVIPIFVILAVFLTSQDVRGQAGVPDPGFQPKQIAVSQVYLQSNGKILAIATSGASVDNPSNLSIVRLNGDGTVDSSFNQSDESVVVNPGSLTLANGYVYLISKTYNGSGELISSVLRRYKESTGKVDAAFSSVTVPGDNVTGYVIEPDGKILVWGDSVYRRSANGKVDSTFQSPDSSLNNTLSGASVTSSGSIYIWGYFLTIGGVTRNGIARLNANGSLDANFVPATNQGAYAFNLIQEPSGTVLASIWDPVSARHTLVRLKADGTAAPSFQSPTFSFIQYTDYNFLETPDGKIMVWGIGIIQIDQTPVTDFARLNADGSVDTVFAANEPVGSITDVLVQPDGKLLLCGSFAQAGTTIVRMNLDGTTDPEFNMSIDSEPARQPAYEVSSSILQPDGKLLTTLVLPPSYYGGDVDGVTLTIGSQPPPPVPPPDYIVRYDAYGSYVPHQVASLTVDAVSPQLTKLAWASVLGATQYKVERLENGQWLVKDTVGASVTTYDDAAVDEVTNFNYRVVAQNAIGDALPSLEIAAAPPAINSFSVTTPSPTQAALSWQPSADAWQYIVYRWDLTTLDSTRTKLAVLPSTATSFSDSDLTPLHYYEYDLVASNLAGTAQGTVYAIMPYNLPPEAPDHFTAGPVAPNEIGFSWRMPFGATGYLIERSANGLNGWQTVATLNDGNTGSYVDNSGLNAGTPYYYRITSLGFVGPSSASAVVAATAPGANWQMSATVDPSFSPIPTARDVALAPSGSIFYTQLLGQYYTPALEEATVTGAKVPTFAPNLGNGTLFRTVLLSNGKVLTAFSYTYEFYNYATQRADETTNYYLTVFSATGSQDTTVTVPTFSGPIYGMAALPNGDVLVTGAFTAVNGQPANGVARLNPDGTLDTTFTMTGITISLNLDGASVATQSDGKIVIVSSGSVIRLFANGQLDSSFGSHGVVALDGYANCIAIQPDDKILAGGSFSTVDDGSGPVGSRLLVRLTAEGKIDPTLPLGGAFGGSYTYVGAVAVDPVGRIVVMTNAGGYFGLQVGTLMRIFQDGSLDPSFQVPSTFDASNFVVSSDWTTFYAGSTLKRYFYNPAANSAPMPYHLWATNKAATGTLNDCPQRDGVPNLLKYVCNIDPSKPLCASDRAMLPAFGTGTVSGTSYLTLTYRQNAAMTGVTVHLQTSSDMKTWTNVSNPTSTQITTDAITGDPVLCLGVPSAGGNQFVRINVSSP